MREIATYTGTGSLTTISDIGLKFDDKGVLSLDTTIFNAAAGKDLKVVTEFLGSTTGDGFLKRANDTINSITDDASGLIPAMVLTVTGEITSTGVRISEQQERVDDLVESLNAQMAAADALIASLQQQATYFTNMFSAMMANQNAMR